MRHPKLAGGNMLKIRVLSVAAIAVFLAVATARAETHTAGVPELNSRAGAAYTLYLDFSGFNFNGKWGTSGSTVGARESFASASPTGSFSATQQSYIRTVWARAAEKYVGMNVNVTTVDPAVAAGQDGTDAARQAYYDSRPRMMHSIVTSTTAAENAFVAGRGGVSYVGVTQNAQVTNGYHTNFVFTDQLSNQGTGNVASSTLKLIAECAGHENGHGLKLSHQSAFNGTTETADYSNNGGSAAVAPVMGNSYGSARGTWRVGPTSSSTTIQNDVALLMTNSGMTTFLDDGIGHSTAAATSLSLAANGVLISANNDGYIVPLATAGYTPLGEASYTADYFKFTTVGGAFTVTINESGNLIAPGVADNGGMLDSVLRLLDGAGNVITSATSAASQTSTITRSLAAGSYYLQVASAGGKTSAGTEAASYFDMGSYFLTGSVAVPEPATLAMFVLIGGAVARRRRLAA